MQAFEVGRIVVKTAGREIGKKAIILSFFDKNYVLISGAGVTGVRRRRSNIKHLEVLDKHVDGINDRISDKEVQKKVETQKLLEFFSEDYEFKV